MPELEKIVSLRLPARADQLQNVRTAVREALQDLGLGAEQRNELVLAIDEACTNIIRHAYGPDCDGDFILEIFTQTDQLIFQLSDFAAPVDSGCLCVRDLSVLRPGGLGVHLIRSVMDEVQFLSPPQGVGNVLEMRKRLNG